MENSNTHVLNVASGSTILPNKITGPWTLSDLNAGKIGLPKHGLTVFSCFHCGGGSTMGYKLAGFDVLGGVEIDQEMMKIYRKNFEPRFSYLDSVQDFKMNPALPRELFNLDVLDGSPPCSSFSMAGNREDDWGKKKKFREGQANQVLDDLFFDFIQIAAKLKPKIVVAENVKGMLIGAAKGYVKEIFDQFRCAGYDPQLFLLNASRMGVPQKRERVFFIARRMDLNLPKLNFSFDEPPISVESAIVGTNPDGAKPLSPAILKAWIKCMPGKPLSSVSNGSLFSLKKLHPKRPSPTLTATSCLMHWKEPRRPSPSEAVRLQSFPDDYNFMDQDPVYVCGMSVPPLMMQRVALEVAGLLLSKPHVS